MKSAGFSVVRRLLRQWPIQASASVVVPFVNNILGPATNAAGPNAAADNKPRIADGFAAIFAALFAATQPISQNALASPVNGKAGIDLQSAASPSTPSSDNNSFRLAGASGWNTSADGRSANSTVPSLAGAPFNGAPAAWRLDANLTADGTARAAAIPQPIASTFQWQISNLPDGPQTGLPNGFSTSAALANPSLFLASAGNAPNHADTSVTLGPADTSSSVWNQKPIVLEAGGVSFPVTIGLAQVPPSPALPWAAAFMPAPAFAQMPEGLVLQSGEADAAAQSATDISAVRLASDQTSSPAIPRDDGTAPVPTTAPDPFTPANNPPRSSTASSAHADASPSVSADRNSVPPASMLLRSTAEPLPVAHVAKSSPVAVGSKATLSQAASGDNVDPARHSPAVRQQPEPSAEDQNASVSSSNTDSGNQASANAATVLDSAPKLSSALEVDSSGPQSAAGSSQTKSHADRPDPQPSTDSGSGQAGSADAAPQQAQSPAPSSSQPTAPANSGAAAHAASASSNPTAGQIVGAANTALPHSAQTQIATAASALQSNADWTPISVDAAQFAARILAKVKDGDRQFDIRLDPPELGRVDVQLSVTRDGQAQAHVVADKPQTLDALQRDQQTLQRALKDAGLDLGSNSLNFSLKGQDRGGDGGMPRYAPSTRTSAANDFSDGPRNLPIISRRAADGRLDIRV